MGFRGGWGFGRYLPVAERRCEAAEQMQRRKRAGHPVEPVIDQGRTIAHTFWGKAWCDNLERYSDYATRLPRGRTYVRNGSVVHLQIAPGQVTAMVSGSSLYDVMVRVAAVATLRWTSIQKDCSGTIDSLVELLEGRLPKGVMERICRLNTGLFPAPGEIDFSCTCPDYADMFKHVAAVLYGIGSRLDQQPELLFRLRNVDEKDLIRKVSKGLPLAQKASSKAKALVDDSLGELFGIEIDTELAPHSCVKKKEPKKEGHRPKAKAKPAGITARKSRVP